MQPPVLHEAMIVRPSDSVRTSAILWLYCGRRPWAARACGLLHKAGGRGCYLEMIFETVYYNGLFSTVFFQRFIMGQLYPT
jgi:hypothetical protein